MTSKTHLAGLPGIADHTQGFEAFYNVAIMAAAQLTLDVPVVESFPSSTDTATILGARLRLVF